MNRATFRLALVLLGFAALTVVGLAATHSLTYTAGQDTTIQTRLIPDLNRKKCKTYGNQAASCSSAQMVTGGCVVITVAQAAGLKSGDPGFAQWSTENYESCVRFTSDAAGEAAYLKEMANIGIVFSYGTTRALEQDDIRAAWPGLSGTARDNFCTTAPPNGLGLQAGCSP